MNNDEILSLQLEFEWFLNEEVKVILSQIQQIILECSRRLCVDINGIESMVKNEKYIFSNTNSFGQDNLKIVVFIEAENITHADISLRLSKHSSSNLKFITENDCQWKLDQVQDASNHLMAAFSLLTSQTLRFDETKNKFDFRTTEEVIQMINSVMTCLQKARNSLIVPKKKTFEELRNSRNMKILQPSIPNDLAITFYIQSHKLICAVYHEIKEMTFDSYQAETSIPWLSEVLVLFTIALQCCQQLKDKASVFTQYKDMQISVNS